jgi:hypothetical protein
MTEHPISRPTSPGIRPSPVDRAAPTTTAWHSSHVSALLRALAAVTAALLAVDAFVHFTDAGFYDAVTGATFSEGTLFRAQAIVAIVVAVTLVVWPRPVVWAVAAAVAASAASAVLLYTYVDVGAIGPVPDLYEPIWTLPGKRASAIAETVATVLALVGLALALRTRRRAAA